MQRNPISKMTRLKSVLSSHYLLPNYVQLESTTKCNLNCETCIRPKEINCDMPLGLFKSIVDQMKGTRFRTRTIDLTGLGEPLLNPHLVSMVKYAKENGFRVGFSSNFTLINQNNAVNLIKAQLDYLYISIDSASKQTFEKIRTGAIFEEVIKNVKLFVKTRKATHSSNPRLMLISTISKSNVGELPQLIKLAEALKVDGIAFFPEITPREEDYTLPISLDWKNLSRSKIEIQASNLSKTSQPCIATRGCYITFDGKILPCNCLIQVIPREQYPNYQFGDLNHNSFSTIWFSSRYKQFRTKIALGANPPICKYCPRRPRQ